MDLKMKTVFKGIAIVVFFSIVFDACKKGDNDPFISLRSRKARVTGEWQLTVGSVTTAGGPAPIVITYDGNKKTEGSTTTVYSENSTFKKNGDYKTVISDDGLAKVREGTWNFSGGVGSTKKKEQLIITILKETTTTGNTTGVQTYSGSQAPIVIYEIDELRNKKIVFKLDGSQSSGNSTTTTVKGSLTYEQ